jgi:aspartyl aminopeptidase
MTKRGTQIAAFKIGGDPKETGLRIGAAHEDSPGFRIKSVPSKVDFGIERISVELYGGLIVHGWLDRPLAFAGRVMVKENGEAKAVNINVNRPVLIIPRRAIHVERGVNDGAKFNPQTQLCPFFAQSGDGKTHFVDFIAKEAGCAPDDVLSFELAPYEAYPGCFVGENEEFMSVARLDDAAMSHAVIKGVIEAKNAPSCDIAVAFDHEECGSNSDRGARSNTIEQIIDRVCEKLGYGTEEKYRALAKSVIFSADMAHATHPRISTKPSLRCLFISTKAPCSRSRQAVVRLLRGEFGFLQTDLRKEQDTVSGVQQPLRRARRRHDRPDDVGNLRHYDSRYRQSDAFDALRARTRRR